MQFSKPLLMISLSVFVLGLYFVLSRSQEERDVSKSAVVIHQKEGSSDRTKNSKVLEVPAKSTEFSPVYSTKGMLTAEGGGVSCKTPEAAKAGLQMLQTGGNAIDAIVATGLAMTVTSTGSNSLGGYGGATVVLLKNMTEPVVIDFTTRAPLEAKPDMFASREETMGDSVLTVTTWNEVAGLHATLERYGTKSWKEVIQPAIRIAEEGFVLSEYSADAIRRSYETKFKKSKASMKLYGRPEGGPLQAGDLFKQPDLAKSLRMLAEKGPDVIYTGELAQTMVDHIRSIGGIVSMKDLENWREQHVRIQRPAHTNYRGYDIYTSPILTGGENLIAILNLLKGFDLPKMGFSAESVHLILESFKLSWADRLWHVADPWVEKVPYVGLMSDAYADERRKLIDPKKVMAYGKPGDPWKFEGDAAKQGNSKTPPDPGMRHVYNKFSRDTATYSAVDKDGNIVALTKTMRNNFGSGITVPGTGITLNNGMGLFLDDLESKKNSIKGGKLALNNMNAFLITKDGKPYVTGGGVGGRRIMTECVTTIVNLIDWKKSIHEAVNAPRFHMEYKEPGFIEKDFPQNIRQALEKMGHQFKEQKNWGRVHAIAIDPSSKKMQIAREERMSVSTAAGLVRSQ